MSEPTPTFRVYLERLHSAQKPGGGVPAYMRWPNRRAARVIAASAASVGLGPNAVTAISAALTAAGLVLLVARPITWTTGIFVAVLLAAGFAFDSADGQVARITGTASLAGEWLDHVVDAIRTPAVHLCVAAAVAVHRPDWVWLVPVAACFAVVASGQFTSQILAEQLVRHGAPGPPEPTGVAKSFLLLPTDTGVLCWGFVLWGNPTAFAVWYLLLFAVNVVHVAASMRRKYRKLAEVSRMASIGCHE